MKPTKETPVICWWSGGITSAVACKICLDTYGTENCRVIMIDTYNEDEDTYRFLADCEKWYGCKIEAITGIKVPQLQAHLEQKQATDYDTHTWEFIEVHGKGYWSIQDVWEEYESLNSATGAICSSNLKREVRKDWQRKSKYCAQAFGFDSSEINRAVNIKKNYPASKPIFPLLLFCYSKMDCIKIVQDAGIEVPRMYQLGFHNNNCFKTGCVQGGIGYWQKMQREFPDKFLAMAEMEHKLTNLKGKPVTCLKDQSGEAKESGIELVFLLPHPDYPQHKDISMMKGREVEPLMECNGFCGTGDSNATKF